MTKSFQSPLLTRLLLIFSMFIMGACGLMYEYVLSVLGNNLMGTSHEQIFVIIGLMLFAMGVGSLMQRVLHRNLLEAFLLLELLLGVIGGFSAVAIYGAFAYWQSFQIILYTFAFLIGASIGMEIPLLIRINTEYAASLRTNLSEVLSVDYLGSLVGALLFAFFFLARFSLAKIGFMLGAVNILIACVGLFYFYNLIERRNLVLGAAVVAVPLLIYGFINAEDWTLKSEQRYYRDPIIYRKTSRFQHIVLTQRERRFNMYLNGNLQFSSLDEHIYHELLVHVPMSVAARRKRVLILGGGDGLALREVLKYRDVREVVLVDIDPAVVKVASTVPRLIELNRAAFSDARVRVAPAGGLRAGERVRVRVHSERRVHVNQATSFPVAEVNLFFLDADKFVRSTRGKFDVVVIDFPDPSLLELSKLFSLDFFRSLQRRVTPEAVVAIQSTSPFFARRAFLCIGQTMAAAGFRVLPYHRSVPSFAGDWGWHLAWPKRPSNPSRPAMLRKLGAVRGYSVATAYLTPAVQRAAFVFGKNAFTITKPIRINTKMRPVLLDYYRKSWRGYEGE